MLMKFMGFRTRVHAAYETLHLRKKQLRQSKPGHVKVPLLL